MWVLGKGVYQGEHCSSKERWGALYFIVQSLLTSESLSWRNIHITCGSFWTLLDSQLMATGHILSAVLRYPISFILSRLTWNYHLDLYVLAVLLIFQLNFFQHLFFRPSPIVSTDVYRDRTSCSVQATSKKSQEIGLCGSYPYEPEPVPSWCCTTVTPYPFLL